MDELTPFPSSVYRRGSRPDPRFSLANERTFLAWIRTSLALLAAGVALEALQVPIQHGFRTAAAGVFVVLGLLSAVRAWFGWMRTERALREDRTLPSPALGAVLSLGVVIAVVLMVIGFFW
jgi:putative membrane protein